MQNPSIGVGLRPLHYPFLENVLSGEVETPIEWFEVISENFMNTQGRPLQMLERFRAKFPIALHGVAMSLGSSEGLNHEYLHSLKELVERVNPMIISDHLCWTGMAHQPTHDLLPLPYTEEVIQIVINNIDRAQSFLKREIAIENVSSYLRFRHSEMSEWQFISEILKRSGCRLLLDVNNVYVNSKNHHFDGRYYFRGLPLEKVAQIHLAGHTDTGEFLFDTHSTSVSEDVWHLFHQLRELLPHSPAMMVEWDESVPEWPLLEAEATKILKVWQR